MKERREGRGDGKGRERKRRGKKEKKAKRRKREHAWKENGELSKRGARIPSRIGSKEMKECKRYAERRDEGRGPQRGSQYTRYRGYALVGGSGRVLGVETSNTMHCSGN